MLSCPTVAPKIGPMSDIKIKAGKNWELEVPVAGEPEPTTKFDMGGNSLEESPRFVTIHSPHKAKISLQGAKREDSGELQLVLIMLLGWSGEALKAYGRQVFFAL